MISEDGTTTYDFENIQRDIVFTFILGKTKISTDDLRKQFQFRQRKHDSFTMDLSVLDLSTIDHHVDKDYKVNFWDNCTICVLDCCRIDLCIYLTCTCNVSGVLVVYTYIYIIWKSCHEMMMSQIYT